MTDLERLKIIAHQAIGLNDWERRFVADMEKRVRNRLSFSPNMAMTIQRIYNEKTEDGRSEAPDEAHRPNEDEGSYPIRRRPTRIRDMFDRKE
jgi:hypothetical protein